MEPLEKAIDDLKSASFALNRLEPLYLSSQKELLQEYLEDISTAKSLVNKWHLNFLHCLLNTESSQSSAQTERK